MDMALGRQNLTLRSFAAPKRNYTKTNVYVNCVVNKMGATQYVQPNNQRMPCPSRVALTHEKPEFPP